MANQDSESTRLANRAAVLSFAAAFAVIVALVTVSRAFDESSSLNTRLAAGVPVLAAVLLVAWAVRARMRWSAHGRLHRPHAGPRLPHDGPPGEVSPRREVSREAIRRSTVTRAEP
jgi:hypothetical protein